MRNLTKLTLSSTLLASALLVGCVDTGSTKPSSSMAPAPLSGEVKALEGMRARNLDSEMNRLGFSNVGGYKTDTASMTTWWNPQGEQCVKVETREGRAASIESIFAGNCK